MNVEQRVWLIVICDSNEICHFAFLFACSAVRLNHVVFVAMLIDSYTKCINRTVRSLVCHLSHNIWYRCILVCVYIWHCNALIYKFETILNTHTHTMRKLVTVIGIPFILCERWDRRSCEQSCNCMYLNATTYWFHSCSCWSLFIEPRSNLFCCWNFR